MDTYRLPDGRLLYNVHLKEDCSGWCVIHNPMDTHMNSWQLHWREDRGIFERICKHGVGHPAPEQAEYLGPYGMTHGCCGCCHKEERDVQHS